MSAFLGAALDFPTVLFSFALVVVVAYWLLVVLGALDLDLLGGAGDGDGDSDVPVVAGMLSALGLGGVPVTLALSLVIVVAWFGCLVGTVLLLGTSDSNGGDPMSMPLWLGLGVGILVAALLLGWLVARLLIKPMRKLAEEEPPPSRHDFIGKTCVIRTGEVGRDFGQAEVTTEDGSSSIIQVRQNGDESLGAGSRALIFEYDEPGEFFWVSAYDSALDPDQPSS